MKRLAIVAASCLLSIILLSVFAAAQVDPNIEQGLKPYGSFEGSNMDSVSLTNGNLTIHLPLWSAPQRGNLGLSVNLVYNNKAFTATRTPVPCGGTHGPCVTNAFWRGTGVSLQSSEGFGTSCKSVPSTQVDQFGNALNFNACTVGTEDGSLHIVADTGNGYYQAIDGTGFRYYPSSSSTLDSSAKKSSSAVSPAMTDANGNQFSGAIAGNSGNLLDTLGRSIPQSVTTGNITQCPSLGYSFQTVSSASNWNFAGPGGTTTLLMCFVNVHIQSNFWNLPGSQQFHEASGNSVMLQSVVLPDLTYYAFKYDAADPNNSASVGYGDLLKITLPTGGSISYTWTTTTPCSVSPSFIPSRVVTSRSVDANDGTGAKTWSYSVPGAGSVVVTDPMLNDTIHVITGLGGSCSLYETETDFYQGSHGSGALLKTVKTDYSYTSNPYDMSGTNPATTMAGVVPIRVTTILPNGQTSKVETDYDSGFSYRDPMYGDPNVFPPQTHTYTVTYGRPVAQREYDWGQGAPGALLRQTLTTYQWQVGNLYFNNNFLDLPFSVKVLDSAGNLCAETDYTYDEGTPANAGISTQHAPAPGGVVRGNLTTVVHKLSNTPCASNASWTTVASHSTWFDTGELQSSTDPGGHITTHLYDVAYQGAYSTQTCAPSTSGIAHCVTGTYDFNTGLLTSFTNENATTPASGNSPGDASHTKSFTYDTMLRMTQALLPVDASNGNARQTTMFGYQSAPVSFPETVTVQRQITSPALWDNSTALFDGLGRSFENDHTVPSGVAKVITTFDALGQAASVTNPYFSTADTTYGVTQSVHDALGRVTQATLQDGSISTTDYSQLPSVTVTDPAGHQRRSRTDALGRLVEVDEPGDPATFVANNYANLAVDGNFAVFGPANDIKWQTNTHGATNTFYSLNMQDDGNLIKYTPTWNTATPTTTGTASYGTMSCVGYRLFAGQTLASGACLQSLNKRFMLVMQTAGNLVQYDLSYSPAHAIFYNSTTGVAGSYLAMQGDGNLVIYTPSGTATWSTGTPTGSGNYMLQVQDPGNLVIYRDIWETGTSQAANGVTNFSGVSCSNIGNAIALNQNIPTGSCLISASGRFALSMQNDGNLALYDRSANPAAVLWSTGTGIQVSPFSAQVELQTLYFYDPLGNLLCVEQHGNVSGTGCSAPPTSDATSPWRVRRFTYDSLSRLLTAHNPESGMITYSYDADGNMLQKTSPAPNQTGSATQTISYCYDELHRVTGKAYSAQTCQGTRLPAGTAVVSYTYDAGVDAKGKLTSLTDQAGTGAYTYDNIGRMASETRVISGVSKTMSYEHNLDGSLSKLHYPSGRVVTYTPDIAGRVIVAADNNGTQYVSSATYFPNGSEYQRSMPGIYFSTTLNPRLQVAGFYSDNGVVGSYYMNKTYNYGALHQNNGNISSIIDNKDSTRTQTFTYDSLDRITSGYSTAATGTYSWGETYSIDAWGNLNIGPMGGKAHGGNFANASDNNNHPLGFTYDAAGNLTNTTQYVYDPENRIQVTAGNAYTYDAGGQRVLKSNSSTGAALKRYWMGSGNVLAEADGSGTLTAEYIYFNGKRIARIDLPANTVHYYLSDHLGSTSKIISSAGVVEEESDFTAFGGELTAAQGANHYKFTSKERDSETGLDYFGARYYSNLMGRFMTPDWAAKAMAVPYADFADPQSLNLYTYVRNNPLSLRDEDGHETADEKGKKIAQAAAAQKGSDHWDIKNTNISNLQLFKSGNDKCNEFASDTVKSGDGTRPVVEGTGKIPTASQFADPKVKITGLSEPKPLSEAKSGDVIAQTHGSGANGNAEGHVGIVVAAQTANSPGQTASANANEGGKVTINDWGFRSPTANPNNGERNGAASPPPVVRHPLGDKQ